MAKAAPKQFHLTAEERLRIENIQLRGQLVQQQQARLQAETAEWRAGIEKRVRCVLADYVVDVASGACEARQKPKVVPSPKENANG